MGNVVRSPASFAGPPEDDDPEQRRFRLGGLLAGEFDDVDVDSVSVVRSVREDGRAWERAFIETNLPGGLNASRAFDVSPFSSTVSSEHRPDQGGV